MCWKNKRATTWPGILFCLVLLCAPSTLFAKSLLRDAEIEHAIYSMSKPVLQTAGIPPEDVKIFLVGDDSVNAFVAGGLNIFVHSGLLKATTNANMLIGVIAHETGHIAGAHLSKLRDIANRATIGSVIGTVIGTAAILAGGGGDVGAGVIAGSQNIAQRKFLTDIRINEQSADHAALHYLDNLAISASGIQEMFTVLKRNERGRNIDPYSVTHPLSKERLSTVRHHLSQSSIPLGAIPKRFNLLHARMRAKLIGFTEPLSVVNRLYPETDQSFAARYARFIAYFKANEFDKAILGLEKLKKEEPNNAFVHDTLGQVFFEFAHIPQAQENYRIAHMLAPQSNLIMTDYAKSLLAENNLEKNQLALDLLKTATSRDKTHSFAWRQLAVAEGRLGNIGESHLALAYESASVGDYKQAKERLARATPLLKEGSIAMQQANDLDFEATQAIKHREEEEDLF